MSVGKEEKSAGPSKHGMPFPEHLRSPQSAANVDVNRREKVERIDGTLMLLMVALSRFVLVS